MHSCKGKKEASWLSLVIAAAFFFFLVHFNIWWANVWRYLLLMGFCEKPAAGCNYTSCCVEVNWEKPPDLLWIRHVWTRTAGGNVMTSPPDGRRKSILTDNAVQLKKANLYSWESSGLSKAVQQDLFWIVFQEREFHISVSSFYREGGSFLVFVIHNVGQICQTWIYIYFQHIAESLDHGRYLNTKYVSFQHFTFFTQADAQQLWLTDGSVQAGGMTTCILEMTRQTRQ